MVRVGLYGGQSAAIAAFAAAALLIGLIVSLAGGGLPSVEVVDALSVGTAASALVVVMLAYAGLAGIPWGQGGALSRSPG